METELKKKNNMEEELNPPLAQPPNDVALEKPVLVPPPPVPEVKPDQDSKSLALVESNFSLFIYVYMCVCVCVFLYGMFGCRENQYERETD